MAFCSQERVFRWHRQREAALKLRWLLCVESDVVDAASADFPAIIGPYLVHLIWDLLRANRAWIRRDATMAGLVVSNPM